MEKKYLIPTIIGVLLLCGIVFTVVYKKGNPSGNKPQVETLAPKETEPIETKTSGRENSSTASEDVKLQERIVVDDNGETVAPEEVERQEMESLENQKAYIESLQEVESSREEAEARGETTQASESETEELLYNTGTEPSPERVEEYWNQQYEIGENIRENTHVETIDNNRKTAKEEVKKLAPEHPELADITDEMIDNYSEEELGLLMGKIYEIYRGY